MAGTSSVHSLSVHVFRLNELCRLCGHRARKDRKVVSPQTCLSLADELSTFYSMNVLEDKDGIHSKSICYKCATKLENQRRRPYKPGSAAVALALEEIEKNSYLWSKFEPTFSISQCVVCSHFEQQSKGGHHTKRKRKKSSTAQKKYQSRSQVDSDASFSVPSKDTSTPVKGPQPPSVSRSSFRVDKALSPFKTRILRPFSQLQAPLTQTEERYFTKLVRIKLSESSDKMTVRCKTGGQPLVLKKLKKPRKASALARTPLKKKRAQYINRIRLNVSGGTEPDAIKQEGTELRTASKVRKQLVLQEANCAPVTITATQGPGLRAMLGLSWTKYRLHKQFLRRAGVKFASEKKEKREQVRAQCGAQVEGQMRSLEVWNENEGCMELTPTPTAGIKNVPAFVINLLDTYDRQGRLIWHKEGEVWIKIGGDHGGGSFKFMLQIANLSNANSKHNTCVFTIAECKDTPNNLRRLLEPYQDQVKELQTMTWRGKPVRLFLFGDYEFLTKVYGLSGAQSIHPCLYCTTSKVQMQSPPELPDSNNTLRTLPQIHRDYRKYRRAGKQKAKARLFNNVIRKPIVDIELEQVTPPYLHIMLGVVKKHHDLLEQECHSLDEQLAKSLALKQETSRDNFTAKFQEYVQQIRSLEEKQRRLRLLKAQSRRSNSEEIRKKIRKAQNSVDRVESQMSPLPFRSGPITANLDSTLRKNRIFPQAYHARALNGNHCNKYLKVYTSISFSVLEKAEELTDDSAIKETARAISSKYDTLNRNFSDVHLQISHQKSINEEDISKIETSIRRYMKFYRETFPNVRIIPKQHLLEHHCVPWITRWGTGMALLGEQGGEETHATINILKKRVWGLRNKQQQLSALLKEHLTLVSPILQGLILLPKEKKQ